MGMVSFVTSLFRPDNSPIEKSLTMVSIGAARVERSANRLHDTLSEMLDKNDRISFRGKGDNGKDTH